MSHCTGIDRTLPPTRYSSSSGEPPQNSRRVNALVVRLLVVNLLSHKLEIQLIWFLCDKAILPNLTDQEKNLTFEGLRLFI